jgi:hypothetical protein
MRFAERLPVDLRIADCGGVAVPHVDGVPALTFAHLQDHRGIDGGAHGALEEPSSRVW